MALYRVTNDRIEAVRATTFTEWPDLQDRMLDQMIRLEAALKGPVQALKL